MSHYHLNCEIYEAEVWQAFFSENYTAVAVDSSTDSCDTVANNAKTFYTNTQPTVLPASLLFANRLSIEQLDYKLALSLYLGPYRQLHLSIPRLSELLTICDPDTGLSINPVTRQASGLLNTNIKAQTEHNSKRPTLLTHSADTQACLLFSPSKRLTVFPPHRVLFILHRKQWLSFILTAWPTDFTLDGFFTLLSEVSLSHRSDQWLDVPDAARVAAELFKEEEKRREEKEQRLQTEALKQTDNINKSTTGDTATVAVVTNTAAVYLNTEPPTDRSKSTAANKSTVKITVNGSTKTIKSLPPPTVPPLNRDQLSSYASSSRSSELAGFRNIGNSCYMNAILQALLGIPSFVEDLCDTQSLPRAVAPDSLYQLLLNIVQQVRMSHHGVIDIAAVKSTIGRRYETFAGSAQQDCHEFLSELITHLTDDVVATFKHTKRKATLPASPKHEHTVKRVKTSDETKQCVPHNNTTPLINSDAAESNAFKINTAANNLTSPSPHINSSTSTMAAPPLNNCNFSPHPNSASSRCAMREFYEQCKKLSPTYKNFHCEIEYTLQCTSAKCRYSRRNTEQFIDFSLDIPHRTKQQQHNNKQSEPVTQSHSTTTIHSSPTASPMSQLSRSPEAEAEASPIIDVQISASNPQLTLPPLQLNQLTLTVRANNSTNQFLSTSRTNSQTAQTRSPTPSHSQESTTQSTIPIDHKPDASTLSPSQQPPHVSTPLCPKHGFLMTYNPIKKLFRCKHVAGCKHWYKAREIPPAYAKHNATVKQNNLNKATTTIKQVNKRLSSHPSLSSLLLQFFDGRIIECNCPQCPNNSVHVTARIKQLPRVLILHLKRFLPNWQRGGYEKRNDRVKVDQTLDLSFACERNTLRPNTSTLNHNNEMSVDSNTVLVDHSLPTQQSSPANNNRADEKETRQSASNSSSAIQATAQDETLSITSKTSRSDDCISESSSVSGEACVHLHDRESEDRRLRRRFTKDSQTLTQHLQYHHQTTQTTNSPSKADSTIRQETDKISITNNNQVCNDLSAASTTTSSPLPLLSPVTYRLHSIVHHKGLQAYAGHYLTDLRFDHAHSKTDNTQEVWKRYDDQFVKTVTAQQVLRQAESEGYVFFFLINEDQQTESQQP